MDRSVDVDVDNNAGALALSLAAIAALVLGACAEPIDTSSPVSGDTVQALFDPASSPPVVPIPTDLARDPATGLLRVPVADANKQPAQAYLDRYLNTLDGYPTSVTAEARFSGELDPKTISEEAVVVVDVTLPLDPVVVSGLIVEHEKSDAKSIVRVWNPKGWRRGGSYAIYVMGGGGERGIKARGGAPIIRSAMFELVTGERPLCAWDPERNWDSSTGTCSAPAAGKPATGCCTDNFSTLIRSSVEAKEAHRTHEEVEAEVLAAATQLEQIRGGYDKLLDIAEAVGLGRDEVALLWSFTTVDINEAVFDPTGSPPSVPTPTDLVRDPKSGMLRIPTSPTASPAEKEFNAYLNTLDGYPVGSTPSVSFTKALEGADLERGVLIYKLAAPKLIEVTGVTPSYDAKKRAISLAVQGGFERGATYVVAAVGDELGLQNKDRSLTSYPIRSATMHLALSPTPLCDFDTATRSCKNALVSSFIDDPEGMAGARTGVEKATSLETIRRGYDPVVQLLCAAANVQREEIAALWTFTVTSQAEILYDPASGAIPFPNNLLLDPATGKVNIPATPNETAGEKALRQGLNTLDGFTTLGTYFAPYTGPIRKTSVPGSVLALDTDAAMPDTSFAFELDETAGALKVIPTTPLKERTTYAVVVISRSKPGTLESQGGLADAQGRYIVPSSFMALLRSRHPVFDAEAGRSLVSAVDDATAELVEKARVAHKPLFDALTPLSIEREQIVAAWTFTTQSITEPLTQLRALPWKVLATIDGNAPQLVGTLDPSLAGFPGKAPPPSVGGWIEKGTFKSWLALDEQGTGTLLPDPTKGKPVDLEFTLTVPKTPMPATGWPVVVFQHGINNSRRQPLNVANALAERGLAMIAFDAPYHGSRTWCTQDLECVGTCDQTTGVCADKLKDTDGDGTPDASGGGKFLNTANPFAIRDSIRQYVVDAAAMLRTIALGGASTIKGPKVMLDPSKVYLAGTSLGGIMGTLVAATDSLPVRGVFAVPGAPVVDIYLAPDGSPTYKPIKEDVLKAYKITEGSLEHLRFVTTFKWIMDPAEPANLARFVTTEQLDDLLKPGTKIPNKQVIVQIAGNDQTIPPHFGEYLAKTLGVDTTDTFYPGQDHDLVIKPDPDPKIFTAAQSQLATFLATGVLCKPDLSTGACN